MSVYLPVGFPVEPYAVTHCANTICARHGIFCVRSVKMPGAKFPVKHRAFLYVILSEPPEKTSTEFYIIRKISELTFLYFKQKRYDFVRLHGPLNRTVFFKVALRTLS